MFLLLPDEHMLDKITKKQHYDTVNLEKITVLEIVKGVDSVKKKGNACTPLHATLLRGSLSRKYTDQP